MVVLILRNGSVSSCSGDGIAKGAMFTWEAAHLIVAAAAVISGLNFGLTDGLLSGMDNAVGPPEFLPRPTKEFRSLALAAAFKGVVGLLLGIGAVVSECIDCPEEDGEDIAGACIRSGSFNDSCRSFTLGARFKRSSGRGGVLGPTVTEFSLVDSASSGGAL